MLLIPAIDLKDGHCVRLKQGEMDAATVFSEDPRATARHWIEQGARRLHVVDLNGAFAGKPKNQAAIKAILAEVGKPPHFVQEGTPYNEDIIVERVLPDHVVLRRKGDGLPIALPLTVLPGVTAPDGQKPPDGHPEATPRPPENGTQSVEKSDKT